MEAIFFLGVLDKGDRFSGEDLQNKVPRGPRIIRQLKEPTLGPYGRTLKQPRPPLP